MSVGGMDCKVGQSQNGNSFRLCSFFLSQHFLKKEKFWIEDSEISGWPHPSTGGPCLIYWRWSLQVPFPPDVRYFSKHYPHWVPGASQHPWLLPTCARNIYLAAPKVISRHHLKAMLCLIKSGCPKNWVFTSFKTTYLIPLIKIGSPLSLSLSLSLSQCDVSSSLQQDTCLRHEPLSSLCTLSTTV